MPGIGDLRTAAIEAESWVDELTRRLGWRDRERGYLVLVATLHALRDSLPRQEVVFIGAQLPALLRGVYYDGWHGDGGPASRNRTAFLARVHDGVRQNPAVDPEEAARAVFATIAAHLPATELEEAKAATPSSLHTLWPS